MKKVFEFICEISQSGKRLDIFLFEKINDKGPAGESQLVLIPIVDLILLESSILSL